MNKHMKFLLVLLSIVFLFVSCINDSDNSTPDGPVIEGTWPFWESAAVAGWSTEKLEQARAHFSLMDSAAVVVVYQGKVLCAWGDYRGGYLTHSVRKSFMSAVYGIYVDRGQLDLNKTMEELGIDDVPPLTRDEKQAMVIHLLQARSGVYHTAAAETQSMHDYKPERGTYAPGEFWCYNNWDFNALATIFDQETDSDFFTALNEDLLQKLGAEDYIPQINGYSYQLDRSIHPAYGFRISARDCARFGLLFLQNGKWGDEQIISPEWVAESTAMVSDAGDYFPGTYYGYMWWIYPQGYGAEWGLLYSSRFRTYAALGAYGQVIAVIPDAELVFVHRVNSYQGDDVPLSDITVLLDKILAARY